MGGRRCPHSSGRCEGDRDEVSIFGRGALKPTVPVLLTGSHRCRQPLKGEREL
jgi:hypothetical protein